MPAIDGLSEVAGRAAQAEATARSVTWQDQDGIDAAARRVDRSLAQNRVALARPGLSAVGPSDTWQRRVADLVDPRRDELVEPPPADPVLAAARAEADADAAVAVARLSLIEAHRAVLQARSAALRAGDSEAVAAAVRGYRDLPSGNTALVKLAIGLGLAYLGFLRLFHWDTKSEMLPYLAIYALSGVIGGVVCTNALSWTPAGSAPS